METLILTLLLPFFSPAPNTNLVGYDCPHQQIFFGERVFNRQYTASGGCLIQIAPRNRQKTDYVYREYIIEQSGKFMVSNSTTGPYETATIQRNYFVFPAALTPTMNLVDDVMTVTLANGSQLKFEKDNPFIAGTSPDLKIRESKEISLETKDSFEIEKISGLLLDTGWKVGTAAHRDPEGISSFYSEDLGPCAFYNKDLFQYIDPTTRQEHPQPIFMYYNYAILKADLLKSCPQMTRATFY